MSAISDEPKLLCENRCFPSGCFTRWAERLEVALGLFKSARKPKSRCHVYALIYVFRKVELGSAFRSARRAKTAESRHNFS